MNNIAFFIKGVVFMVSSNLNPLALIISLILNMFNTVPAPTRPIQRELSSPDKFIMWCVNNDSGIYNNYAENSVFQEIEEITGTTVTFVHPHAGSANEQFNLMIASGDIADVIVPPSNINNYILECVIPINDYLDDMPNFKPYTEIPEIKKQITHTDGNIYSLPIIHKTPVPKSTGLSIRENWIMQLELFEPRTIEEWYQTLKAIKEARPDSVPLLSTLKNLTENQTIMGAFSATKGFYQDSGTVKFGAIEPAYKEFLSEMNKWYSEGLLDPDFVTTRSEEFDFKVKNNAFAMINSHSQINRYQDVNFTPVPDPFIWDVPRLETPITYTGDIYALISNRHDYPSSILGWFDCMYGEDFSNIMNYGVNPEVYTEPDGKLNPELLRRNTAPAFPFLLDNKRYLPAYSENAQKAVHFWSDKASQNTNFELLPKPLFDYDRLYQNKMTDINVFVDEMTVKFIMGVTDLNEFDRYVDFVKKMGISDAIKTQQERFDGYNSY